MMAGRGGSTVAGGLARHVPVLVRPALELLNLRDGGVYIDGTFGAGGYTRAILAAAGDAGDRASTATRARWRSAPVWCRRRADG